MNQQCKVCGEPAAGFHFGAFTCEGCKSFFGRTYNNLSSISECKNNGECVINKKNRTACKACRLRKCLLVGMSKSGSRYGRRSNWFKIHCLLQEQQQAAAHAAHQAQQAAIQTSHAGSIHGTPNPALNPGLNPSNSPKGLQPADLAGFFASTFGTTFQNNNFLSPLYRFPPGLTIQHLETTNATTKSSASDSGTSSAEDDVERSEPSPKVKDQNFFTKNRATSFNGTTFPISPLHNSGPSLPNTSNLSNISSIPPLSLSLSPSSDPGTFYHEKRDKYLSPPMNRVSVSSLSWPNSSAVSLTQNSVGSIDPNAWKDLWLRSTPAVAEAAEQNQPIDLSVKSKDTTNDPSEDDASIAGSLEVDVEEDGEGSEHEESVKTTPLDLTLDTKQRPEEVAT